MVLCSTASGLSPLPARTNELAATPRRSLRSSVDDGRVGILVPELREVPPARRGRGGGGRPVRRWNA